MTAVGARLSEPLVAVPLRVTPAVRKSTAHPSPPSPPSSMLSVRMLFELRMLGSIPMVKKWTSGQVSSRLLSLLVRAVFVTPFTLAVNGWPNFGKGL